MQTADGVRGAVEAVESELVLLAERTSPAGSDGLSGLRATWGKLVDVLALGPAPYLLECPHCGSLGMAAATRCGSCWQKLAPPPEPAERSGSGGKR